MATVSKIDSSGNFFSGGDIDEFSGSVTNLSGQVITYGFSAGIASVTLLGSTITGTPGFAVSGSGASPTSGGGSFTQSLSLTGKGALVTADGVRGGHPSYQSPGNGGWGGSIGARDGIQGGTNTNRIQPHNDVSGLDEVLTAAGYNITYAGGGSLPPLPYNAGQFPGGGGGGGNSGAASLFGGGDAEAGGNAGVAIKYITKDNTTTNLVINEASGNGTITLPANIKYAKMWAIGRGGSGLNGYGQGGAGGGAGGTAYMTFDYASVSSIANPTTVSKQYSNGALQTFGEFDEFTNGVFSNQPITYDFTGGDALVTFMGATLIGNNGNNGGNVTPGAGGGYSISQTGYVYWTANRGGSTGTSGSSGGSGGNGGSGGGGSITDVSGLKAAVTDSGQTFAGTRGFGVGARSSFGGAPQSQDIPGFAGGGAAGLSAGNSQDPITTTGANAGVVVKYTVWGVDYYEIFGSASQTSGGFTLPIGTSYVKIWCIGKGGNGGPDGGISNGGGGGGGGGVAYAEFDSSLL